MTVEVVERCTDDVVHAINELIPQLSRTASEMSKQEVLSMLDQPGVILFFFRAQEGGPVLGMLTLATFQIPTGRRAWIEDVVVAEDARGHGAGKALVDAAVAKAFEMGCKTVDLTSRPTREAANRLYKRCGFELRDTNVYRFAAK